MTPEEAAVILRSHGLYVKVKGGPHGLLLGGEHYSPPEPPGYVGLFNGRSFVIDVKEGVASDRFEARGHAFSLAQRKKTYVARWSGRGLDVSESEHETLEGAVQRLQKAFPKIFGVCALIPNPDQRRDESPATFLSVNRPGRPDDFALIGGKVDPGETPIEAIVRECREETGIVFAPSEPSWIYDRLDSPEETEKVSRCYRVSRFEGTPTSMEPGFTVKWSTIEELTRPGGQLSDYNRDLFKLLGRL